MIDSRSRDEKWRSGPNTPPGSLLLLSLERHEDAPASRLAVELRRSRSPLEAEADLQVVAGQFVDAATGFAFLVPLRDFNVDRGRLFGRINLNLALQLLVALDHRERAVLER